MKLNTNFIRLMHESILTYDMTVKNDHAFKFTGVFSTLENNTNYNYLIGYGFINDATTNEALQLAQNFGQICLIGFGSTEFNETTFANALVEPPHECTEASRK